MPRAFEEIWVKKTMKTGELKPEIEEKISEEMEEMEEIEIGSKWQIKAYISNGLNKRRKHFSQGKKRKLLKKKDLEKHLGIVFLENIWNAETKEEFDF